MAENKITGHKAEHMVEPQEPQKSTGGIEYWISLEKPRGLRGTFKLIITKALRRLSSNFLQPILEQQVRINRETAEALRATAFELAGIRSRVGQHDLDIIGLSTALSELRVDLAGMGDNARYNMEELRTKAGQLEQQNQELTNLTAQIKSDFDQTTVKVKKVQDDFLTVMVRLGRLQRAYSSSNQVLPDDYSGAPGRYDAFDYFAFESRFRGAREDIRKKQEVYLPYFKDRSNILDFGCGRGEFLELLKENGIAATGVDLNADNVAVCEQLGLDVRQQDAVDYLEACEDNSLGGIIALQIVEHLSIELLQYVLDLAHRKMQPGAPFIMETLNPQCLMIYAESMFLDPSHFKPVHPYTLQFMAESAGFVNNELLFMTPSDSSMKIPEIPEKSEFNTSINVINGLLFGNREYALITYK